MQFRPSPPPQVRDVRPAHRPPPSDRNCPLDTARDRCLWHAGGTAGENDDVRTWRDGSQLDRTVRSVLRDQPLRWQEPGGFAAAGWGDSNSMSLASSTRGQEAIGSATCGFD
jgi:hypothetical protein